MIWGSGTWGHVAIFVEGDVDSFRSMDQNYPTGSPCHIQNHTNYDGVLGWIRFKRDVDTGNLQAEFDKCRVDRDNWWNALITIADKLKVVTSLPVIFGEIDKILTFEGMVIQKDRQLQEVQQRSIDLQKDLNDTVKLLKETSDHNAMLTAEVEKDQLSIQGLKIEVNSLSTSLQSLQSQSTNQFKGWKLKVFNWLLKVR
jgi:hypothetical protein